MGMCGRVSLYVCVRGDVCERVRACVLCVNKLACLQVRSGPKRFIRCDP